MLLLIIKDKLINS